MNTFPILLVKIISNTTKQIQHDEELVTLLQPTSRRWAKYFSLSFGQRRPLYSNNGTSTGASVSTFEIENFHLPFIVEQVSSKVCWGTGSANSSAASHFLRSLLGEGCSPASVWRSWPVPHGPPGVGISTSASATGLSFRFWLSLRKISFFSLCKRKEWVIFVLKHMYLWQLHPSAAGYVNL